MRYITFILKKDLKHRNYGQTHNSLITTVLVWADYTTFANHSRG